MKTILILILLVNLLQTECSAQNRSIRFQNIDFEKALEQAKTESKNIFMDCYTSWCGPCKAMARDVFTIDSVADYFNSTFICVKYDIEKEGKELVKKYPIDCYPTFLILNPEGKELHRLSGYYKPDDLMQAIRLARPENTIEALENKYVSGERTPGFMNTYLTVLKGNGRYKQIGDILSTLPLYRSEKDIENPILWRILNEYHTHTETPDARFFLTHITQFKQSFGTPAIDELLDKLFSIEVTFYMFWEQNYPNQTFEIDKLNRFIDKVQQHEFAGQDRTLVLAITEKKYREKQAAQSLQLLQTARELCIFPKAHQMRFFTLYVDKLIDLAERPETLKALREECNRMQKDDIEDMFLLTKKYRICYKLHDEKELQQLKSVIEDNAQKTGYQVIFGNEGQIELTKK